MKTVSPRVAQLTDGAINMVQTLAKNGKTQDEIVIALNDRLGHCADLCRLGYDKDMLTQRVSLHAQATQRFINGALSQNLYSLLLSA